MAIEGSLKRLPLAKNRLWAITTPVSLQLAVIGEEMRRDRAEERRETPYCRGEGNVCKSERLITHVHCVMYSVKLI